MKKFTQKSSYLFSLFLLGVSYMLSAANSVHPLDVDFPNIGYRNVPSPKRKWLIYGYCNAYNIPSEICFMIRCLVYDNPLRYKNQPLPHDLSEEDLSGFDFTGCHFTHTNLSRSNLAYVILTNTTCNYQKAFEENIKKNKLEGGDWYKENLPNDLKSITKVYPTLKNNTHKAKLLKIACGISQLPFYEETEFYIQVAYWSSALLQLKQLVGSSYRDQLVCSLVSSLSYDATDCCWTTNFPQDKITIGRKMPHTSFPIYLHSFTKGLTQYQCKSVKSWGLDWYKDNIIKNIQGLQKTYPHISNQQLQEIACEIAQALSKSYQLGQSMLLDHYLFYQDYLIWFKKSVSKVSEKNEIYYSEASTVEIVGNSWSSIA